MPDSPQRSSADLGRANRRRVLAEILYHAPIARTEIADHTGLNGASVSRITRDLINAGLVSEHTSSAPLNRSGRRLVELTLNPDGAYMLGFSINAFAQWVCLFGPDNNVVDQRELSVDNLADPLAVLNQIIAAAEKMIETSTVSPQAIIGAAVAMGGPVEPESGKLMYSTSMGWGEVEIAPLIAERLGVPVRLETVPNALNLAETRFGIAKGYRNVVLVNASLNMGASLLLDNYLRRGMNNAAGFIGRLDMHNTSGGSSLLDDLASGMAVLAASGTDTPQQTGRRAATELMALKQSSIAGDPEATAVFYNAGQMLSQALEMVITLLQPEMIIVAGPMASVPAYEKGLMDAFNQSAVATTDHAQIRVSRMGGDEAVRLLACDEFLTRQDIDLDRLQKRSG